MSTLNLVSTAFWSAPDIQVVSICTPSGTHAELGIKAAAAGKHVVVEKPIDVTLEKARMLIDACHKARVKLAVIFQARFLPAVQILKSAIDRNRLGTHHHGRCLCEMVSHARIL